MTPPTLYVETSVWGSLAPGQPRDRKQIVIRLLGLLGGVRGACVISDTVTGEIKDAPPEEAEVMRAQIDRARARGLTVLEPEKPAKRPGRAR